VRVIKEDMDDKAGIKLDVLRMTEDERKTYEKFLINRQSLDSSFRTTRADALAEGKAEGKAEEKAQIAKIMKNKGMDTNIIAEITGLTVEEIARL
jgi:predicted transposase/invertase (TIGR01784 family)